MDLEWNGGYTKKAHGYFNEIIEIGATRLNDRLQVVDGFHELLCPVVTRKLSDIVTDLTSITEEELKDGASFPLAVLRLKQWIGSQPAVLLTWSTTDLLVLIENCRYFLHTEHIPFMEYYADAQAYCQQRLGTGSSQQLGLSRACELLHLSEEGMDLHRAQDDSVMTALVLTRVFEPESFAACVKKADEAFYGRLTFKTTYLHSLDDPRVKRSWFRFACEACGGRLRTTGEWQYRNRGFVADMKCRSCGRQYVARVQAKLKYDGVAVKRKLREKTEPAEQGNSPAAEITGQE